MPCPFTDDEQVYQECAEKMYKRPPEYCDKYINDTCVINVQREPSAVVPQETGEYLTGFKDPYTPIEPSMEYSWHYYFYEFFGEIEIFFSGIFGNVLM